MLASVPGSQKHPSSREMYGRLRGSGSLRGAFLGSDVIFAQQGVSVSFQSRYGAIISMVLWSLALAVQCETMHGVMPASSACI